MTELVSSVRADEAGSSSVRLCVPTVCVLLFLSQVVAELSV